MLLHFALHRRRGAANSFPSLAYSAPGGLRQDPGRGAESLAESRTYENGGCEVRVVLSTYDSREGVEPLVALEVRAGTTATAGRAGAPQVVVPQMADQPYWAGRVAELGIGVAYDGRTPTTTSLSAALQMALTPRPAHERPPWQPAPAPTERRWSRRSWSTRSAEKRRPCPREPGGIIEPGPRTREPANPGHLSRQPPRGPTACGVLLVMAARFVTPRCGRLAALWLPAISDRS